MVKYVLCVVSTHKAIELRREGPEAIFQIGDVIRTWRISQSSVAVSHENLDVEYYRFDYQFYQRIQFGNFLVVSS